MLMVVVVGEVWRMELNVKEIGVEVAVGVDDALESPTFLPNNTSAGRLAALFLTSTFS